MTIFQISSIMGHFYHLPFLLGTYVLGHSDLVINDYIFIQESKHNQGYWDELKSERNDILINLCGLLDLLCLLWGLRRGWNELSQVLTVKGINEWNVLKMVCTDAVKSSDVVTLLRYQSILEEWKYCWFLGLTVARSEFWESLLLFLLLFLYNKSSIICVITQDSTLSIQGFCDIIRVTICFVQIS